MSTAKKYNSGNGKVASEKSNFTMTCNRLNSFLKENGSLKDLGINANFDIIGKSEKSATVDFLSKLESPVDSSTKKSDNSMNHFLPQYVTLESFCKLEDSSNKSESETAQMTIFYQGKVLEFDHISPDKARDIMLLGSSTDSTTKWNNSLCEAFGKPEYTFSRLQVNESDLPIARRVSLHKFLAKRKERAVVRAPYPVPESASMNYKFDLNL